ncbi:MAG: Maf family protein, partial [Gammaproteobacteria bacterium]
AIRTPDAIVIGSDQVASFETDIIGKPGSKPHAAAQLRRFSGQEVELLTAVCVIRTETTEAVAAVVPTTVRFRSLSDSEIDAYLEVDQPFDCAGSFKAEKFGIALFEWIRSDDPTALPGLPLITVVSALRSFGVKIA